MGFNFNVVEAKREKIFVKGAILGASGSGKTYSSLLIATGMLKRMKERGLPIGNGKILFLNTEGPRGRYYANEFKYDIVDLVAPHNPEMYVAAINFAVESGYPIAILDSSSPEWEGQGGCLDLQQQAGGTFQAWAKVTPRHDKFIQAIAYSPIHLLVTMRGKDQYEIEKDGDKSKTSVKKLGVGAKQRDGFEYEFSWTAMTDNTFSTTQKDNTHLFENRGAFRFTEKDGEAIIDWAESGEGYTPMPKSNVEPEKPSVKPEIIELCKKLGGAKNTGLMNLIKEYEVSGNPNKITNENKLQTLYDALLKFEAESASKEDAVKDATETVAE